MTTIHQALEESKGTVKMPETHYAVYDGFSNAIDQYTKNPKDFQNRFFGAYKIPEIREIRYNGPATIVFWEDNTKTVVKMQPDEEYYDPDKAFTMAVCKKLFGNKFNRHLTKAQKAFEKSCDEKYEKRVNDFVQRMADANKRVNDFVQRMADANKRQIKR